MFDKRSRKVALNAVPAALLVLILLIPYIAMIPTASAQATKIVIDVSHGQVGRTRRTGVYPNFQGNLTAWGYQIVEANGGINSTILSGANMLFLGAVFAKNFTDSEVTAIASWFNEGSKGIWVGADSDFGNGTYIIDNTNKVLAALGSKIRAEPTQVLDPVSNAAADYRVVANVVNTDPKIAGVTTGVSKILFHGPTILAGVKGGSWVPLESEQLENVYWVLKTSADSIIVDTDLIAPKAHQNGQKGSYVIMAVEMLAGAKSNSKIIVSGGDPYGDYEPVFQWAYYGVQLNGPALVKNSVGWALQVENPPPPPPPPPTTTTPPPPTPTGVPEQSSMLIVAAILVIIILVAAGLYMRRRKK